MWPETKDPCFVSGGELRAEGAALGRPGLHPIPSLAPESSQTSPEGCGSQALGKPVDLWWRCWNSQVLGGGILGVIEASSMIPEVGGQETQHTHLSRILAPGAQGHQQERSLG